MTYKEIMAQKLWTVLNGASSPWTYPEGYHDPNEVKNRHRRVVNQILKIIEAEEI